MSETPIDLSRLPAPDVVESLDFETVFQSMLADLRERDSDFDALVESDPAYKVLETAAYRELNLRQRVNDSARAVMLAFSSGSDLDHLVAAFGVERQVVDEGDPDAVPPVEPTYESDERLRERAQMAMESMTTAGSRGSYRFHALSADPDVKDVSVTSPRPGEVLLSVLSASGDGTPDQALLDAVESTCSAEDVRPLSDHVRVEAAEIVAYEIQAELFLFEEPDAEAVREQAEERVRQYVSEHHRLGHDITLSGLYASLHVAGVQRVELASPAGGIVCDDTQAAYCQAVSVEVGGRDE